MEFDPSWLLLALPLAFALGWWAARLDLRQGRDESRRAPKAYFKGLNFLLNEQQDQAIDAFIEAVQSDPDTTELHFALGNLFRRRGEYHRAVRVHEHLLSRADLARTDRDRAQHGLAQDYLKAGLLDRAEEALRRLEGTAFEAQARVALLSIYERSHDWPQAIAIAERMHTSQQGDYSTRRAHYWCEQAQLLQARGDTAAAQTLLQQAIDMAPSAARARIALARLQHHLSHSTAALESLRQLATHSPSALPLAASLLVEVANATGQQADISPWLQALYRDMPSLDLLNALIALDCPAQANTPDAARIAQQWQAQYLEQEPSLVVAAQWLSHETLTHEAQHPLVQRAFDAAAKPLTRYRCAACGFEAHQHFWQCPGCQSWDSYPPRRVEEL